MRNSIGKASTTWKWWEIGCIILSFVFWMIMFRSYLSGRAALFDDAISYYDHIKYYVSNLRMGVFPLWDPLWFCGAANNFFLQRMGCFNPCLSLLTVVCSLGVPFNQAYLFYLAFYYFLGCFGFYLLAKELFKDPFSPLAAFTFLLFSSLGTRLFDSYLILIFTPVVWFFYFLVTLSRYGRRSAFVGLILSLIIIFTTYIPFYFFLVLLSFLLFLLFFILNYFPLFSDAIGVWPCAISFWSLVVYLSC